ncbi:MAG: hypothetical protein CMO80_04370 [Verrucomicrobiales bacterium]|nr:hypothetical protein [Verrucomicrobiales bacterium]|tara:strand:- start:268 stop:777 length:510 start_codon:yes stop_codon:yes gene_type:complete
MTRLRFLFCLPLALLSGCAGYNLGPTAGFPAGSRSVEVKFFKNETIEPRLVTAMNHAMRKQLQQDGTYRLETRGRGDVVVTGKITEFTRSAISFRPEDVITARNFAVSMVADIKAVDSATGEVLLDRSIAGRTAVLIGDDLASAERQAVPLLAEDLARNATSLLVNGDW